MNEFLLQSFQQNFDKLSSLSACRYVTADTSKCCLMLKHICPWIILTSGSLHTFGSSVSAEARCLHLFVISVICGMFKDKAKQTLVLLPHPCLNNIFLIKRTLNFLSFSSVLTLSQLDLAPGTHFTPTEKEAFHNNTKKSSFLTVMSFSFFFFFYKGMLSDTFFWHDIRNKWLTVKLVLFNPSKEMMLKLLLFLKMLSNQLNPNVWAAVISKETNIFG